MVKLIYDYSNEYDNTENIEETYDTWLEAYDAMNKLKKMNDMDRCYYNFNITPEQ